MKVTWGERFKRRGDYVQAVTVQNDRDNVLARGEAVWPKDGGKPRFEVQGRGAAMARAHEALAEEHPDFDSQGTDDDGGDPDETRRETPRKNARRKTTKAKADPYAETDPAPAADGDTEEHKGGLARRIFGSKDDSK